MIRFFVRLFLLIVVALAAVLAWALWPRTGDLRGFDSAAVARLETAMWRDYYERDYNDLMVQLYKLHHDEYHFSPAYSVQLAMKAGAAAKLFQPTTNRDEAQVALPELIKYFTLLQEKSGEDFDPIKVAAIELDWWQIRRETNAPENYAPIVASVSEELFGVSNPLIKKAAAQRARMMRYRDDRRAAGAMQASDWKLIETNLIESYADLKKGVARKL